VFKMFMNESKGEVMPEHQLWWSSNMTDGTGNSGPDNPDEPIWGATGPDGHEIYPEYCTDGMIFICPSDTGLYSWAAGDPIPNAPADAPYQVHMSPVTENDMLLHYASPSYGFNAYMDLENTSYTYINKLVHQEWMAEHDSNAMVMYCLFDSIFLNKEAHGDKKANIGGSFGQVTFLHLREGIERFTITDINSPAGSANAQSEIVVLYDMAMDADAQYGGDESTGVPDCAGPDTHVGEVRSDLFNHIPGGSNILFLDGHVSFGKYPQPDSSPMWCMTENTLAHSSD